MQVYRIHNFFVSFLTFISVLLEMTHWQSWLAGPRRIEVFDWIIELQVHVYADHTNILTIVT